MRLFPSLESLRRQPKNRSSRCSTSQPMRKFRRAVLETLETRTVMDGSVIISEILAANSGGLSDADGDSSDWIELYNSSSSAINLDGWHLTDNAGDMNQWRLPSVSIGANDFLMIFASGKNRAVPGSELHTNFRLSTGGEYLALVQPDGAISSEFTPKFSSQVSNVSYGAVFDSTVLIQDGSPTQILVPNDASLGNNWLQPSFDASGWISGPLTLGFGVKDPGFDVTYVKASVVVGDLSAARDVLNDSAKQASKVKSTAPVVNYLANGGAGHFGNDLPFPTQAIGDDIDDFVIQAAATLEIPSAGDWTFVVNSDDGFELKLEKDGVVFQSEFANPRAANDTFATFNLPSAGAWQATLIMYERGGGASVEMFAAPGAWGAFDPAAFDLVGDVANGGLPAYHGLPVTTNLESQMLGQNASAYIRIPFVATNPTSYESLVLKMRYDDGFVAYLNGVEVARRNAPANLNFNSSAVLDRSRTEVEVEESISLTDYLGLLVPGQNVLAIQGLNSSSTDDSFLIQAQLRTISVQTNPARYFALPSPGDVNTTPFLGVVERVSASMAGGFYSNPFSVTLTTATPGATIRYTLDGSTPTTTNGLIYTDPIQVSGTLTLRSAAFLPDYVSLPSISRTYIFVSDVLQQSPDGSPPPGWPSTWGNNVVDYGIDPDVIAMHGAPAVQNALLAIPSLALTTDLVNLFDAQIGIYGNAYGDGREWERPASLELLNPDGSPGFQVNAGVRIRGGFSRSGDNPKHSFRFFFRGQYGDSTLDFPLFGTAGTQSFKKMDLRTAQNYSWSFGGDPSNTFISDVFAREVQRDMGQPYTRSNWYHLYINGQYWGLFQTQERAEAEYAASYFGGLPSNYDVLKPEAGPYEIYATDGNDRAYRRLWEAANGGFVSNADYMRVQGKNLDGTENLAYEALLDVDNLIVYMINILYGGNLDAPISNFLGNQAINNFFAVRDRTGRAGFKFFIHDSEHTLLPWGLNENRNGPYPAGAEFRHFNPQWLHQRLMENAEYRIRFADKVQESFFGNGPLTVTANQARYQNHVNQLDQAIIAESARWGDAKRPNDPLDRNDWLNAVSAVRDVYLVERGNIVLNQWRANGLFPAVGAPLFYINGELTNGGQVAAGSTLRFAANEGLVYYTLDGTDPRLQGGGISPSALVYDPIATTETLVSEGTAWRYSDLGTDLGTAWRAAAYDDTAWSSGNAELGYGDGDEVTTVGYGPNASNRYITTYFRKSFSVADPASITMLTLRLKRDDGAVVYVNGKEVVRSNMPAGPITSSTLALNAIGGTDESTFTEFSIDARLLVPGNNVIAVEIHQSSVTSSDISFDASLIASRQANPGIPLNSSASIVARTRSGDTWSAKNSASVNTAAPANASNFTITEIMYNPPAPTGSEPALDKEEYEFVEFRNISDAPISLDGVRFSAGITFEFNAGTVRFLNPGQSVVVARNEVAFRGRYGDQPLLAGTYGASGTNLSNGGEIITVLDAAGNTIKSFTYDDVAPWPTTPDGGGYSLTARWTSRDYNAASNWRASYLLKGTPGYEENDYPEQLTLSANSIAENLSNTTIGTLTALDPNKGDVLTYAILPGGDASQFSLIGNQLRVGSVGLDFEAGATRTLTLRASDGQGLFVDQLFTIQVIDVDDNPTLGLTFDSNSISEQAGRTIARLTRTNADTTAELVVTLTSSDTSELTVPASVTIPAGEMSVAFEITASDDALLDGPQTVEVSAAASGFQGATASLTVTDAESLRISLDQNSMPERDGQVTLQISRSNTDNQAELVVQLTGSDTTEVNVPATVTIPAGQSSISFQIFSVDDSLLDGPQSVSLTAAADGYQSATASLTVTDVESLIITLDANSMPELGGQITGRVTRGNSDLGLDLIVLLANSDLTEANFVTAVTIPAGQSSVTFQINSVDDTLLDGLQSVDITATANGYASFTTSLTVTDVESLSLALDTSTMPEQNGQITGRVTRSNTDLDNDLVVQLSTSDESEAIVPTTVTIPAGQSSVTFQVASVDDALLDGSQSVTVAAAATGYQGSSTSLTVTDVESLTITLDSSSMSELNGQITASVTRNNTDLDEPLLVQLTSSDSSEVSLPSSLIIPAGRATVSFQLSSLDDDLLDGSQRVDITASAPGYQEANASLTVTDVETLTLTLEASSMPELSGQITGRVTRNNSNLDAELVVQLSSSDTSEASVPASVTIPAGQASVTFQITSVDDALLDGPQSVTIAAAAAGYEGSAAGVSVLDVESLSLSLDASSMSEFGGRIIGRITRSNTDLSAELVVQLSSSDTSEASVPATVTIPSGQASATFEITAVDDQLLDSTQAVTIDGRAVGYETGAANLQVTDWETLELVLDVTTISETDGTAIATISRSNTDRAQPLTVSLTATNPSQAVVPASATIPAGASSVTVTIRAVNDVVVDGSQVVNLSASAVGYQGQATASLTVTDDDRQFPWQNPDDPADVNASGQVTAIDALLVINAINLEMVLPPQLPDPFDPKTYYDVSGDGFLSAIDVLLVINRLNSQVAGEGEANVSSSASDPVAWLAGSLDDVLKRQMEAEESLDDLVSLLTQDRYSRDSGKTR